MFFLGAGPSARVCCDPYASPKVDHGKRFKVADHVRWNSEAGYVSGKILKVHTKDVDYKGHTHHASEHEPQSEIKSDKTDHVAMHKGSSLSVKR
jgi:hypothetical protein